MRGVEPQSCHRGPVTAIARYEEVAGPDPFALYPRVAGPFEIRAANSLIPAPPRDGELVVHPRERRFLFGLFFKLYGNRVCKIAPACRQPEEKQPVCWIARLLGERQAFDGTLTGIRNATHWGAKNRDQPKGSKLRHVTRPHQSIAIAVALNSVVVRPAKIMAIVSPGS
jgi:hypothetical protein